MTEREKRFIDLVRGIADVSATLPEIKSILSSGSLPAPEAQRPAVLPVPHEKV